MRRSLRFILSLACLALFAWFLPAARNPHNIVDAFPAVVAAAATTRYEAYPSLAYDKDGRLWLAWEESDAGWGKDFGVDETSGIGLYHGRWIKVKVWQTKPDNCELCYPFFEKALELGVPVMIDATMDRGFSETQIFEDILKDFPKLKICAGGAGIRLNPVEQNGKTVSAPDRMLHLAEKHENLFLDPDDWQVADQKGIRKYLDYLRRAMGGPAKNRIMFGSDFPVFEWMYTEKEWIEFVLKHVDKREIKFSEQELAMFFSLNALNYLGLKSYRLQGKEVRSPAFRRQLWPAKIPAEAGTTNQTLS